MELCLANISDFLLLESHSICHEMRVRPSHNLPNLVPKTNLAVGSTEFCQLILNEYQILGEISSEKCTAFCV